MTVLESSVCKPGWTETWFEFFCIMPSDRRFMEEEKHRQLIRQLSFLNVVFGTTGHKNSESLPKCDDNLALESRRQHFKLVSTEQEKLFRMAADVHIHLWEHWWPVHVLWPVVHFRDFEKIMELPSRMSSQWALFLGHSYLPDSLRERPTAREQTAGMGPSHRNGRVNCSN